MGLVLKAEEILAAPDVEIVREEVPEWGGDVLIRPLSARDRDRYEASCMVRKGDKLEYSNDNARAKLLARALVDEDGKLLFTPAQVGALGEKNGAVVDRLHTMISELSGMNDTAEKDAEKNSESDPLEDSSSD